MLISLTPHTLFPSWQIRAFICIWVPLVDKERSPRTAEKFVWHFLLQNHIVCIWWGFCAFVLPFKTRSHHRSTQIKLLWWQKPNLSTPCSEGQEGAPGQLCTRIFHTFPSFWGWSSTAKQLYRLGDSFTVLVDTKLTWVSSAPLPSSCRPMLAQVKPAGQGSEPSPLFSTSAATSGKLCPVSGSQTQCRHWQTTASPTDGHKGGQGLEHTL